MDAPVLGPEVNLPLEPGVRADNEAGAVLRGGAVARALAVVGRARHRPEPRPPGPHPEMSEAHLQ